MLAVSACISSFLLLITTIYYCYSLARDNLYQRHLGYATTLIEYIHHDFLRTLVCFLHVKKLLII